VKRTPQIKKFADSIAHKQLGFVESEEAYNIM